MNEVNTQVSEMSLKLGLISEVMKDAYFFVHARVVCEDWQARAEAGEELAAEAIAAINTFHRLCAYVKRAHTSTCKHLTAMSEIS